MGVLSSTSIKELIQKGELIIKPLDEGQIQPASVDLRIANEVMKVEGQNCIEFGKEVKYRKTISDKITLEPKTHILVRTIEYTGLPNNVAGIIKLRSSLSRIGVMLNNAGWIDPGFKGTITLSMFNSNNIPVKIKTGERFVQLILIRLDKESSGYSGKYLEQIEITGNRHIH